MGVGSFFVVFGPTLGERAGKGLLPQTGEVAGSRLCVTLPMCFPTCHTSHAFLHKCHTSRLFLHMSHPICVPHKCHTLPFVFPTCHMCSPHVTFSHLCSPTRHTLPFVFPHTLCCSSLRLERGRRFERNSVRASPGERCWCTLSSDSPIRLSN